MNGARVVASVFKRTSQKVLRRPMILLLSFVQPLIWMLFFGFLFQRFELRLDAEGVRYIDFLLPGICSMTVLLGASQSGLTIVRDHQSGFLARLLASPASYPWILTGKLAADVVRLLLQAVIVFVLGVSLGAKVQVSVYPMLLAVASLGLFAAGYACLSCCIALRTRSQETLAAFVHVVNMPLFFTSTALVPAKQMPDWLATIALWNPFSLVVDIVRQALLSASAGSATTSVAPLLIMASCLFLLAVRSMKVTA